LALIVTAAVATTSVTPYCVDFINKDDTWRLFFSLLEHVANAGSTHPHKHLHKVRTRDREKWNLCLTGYRFCQQWITCSRRTHHQNPTRNLPAQALEFGRIAQIFNQLLHFFFCFIYTSNVCKAGFNLIFTQQARFTFTETHRPATPTSATLHLTHKE